MKILFEHDFLYYLPQFEPIIIWLKNQGKHEIFASLNQSVPKIEKDVFKKEMHRLGVEIVHENLEPQRRRIIKDMNFDIIFVGNKSSLSAIKNTNTFSVMIYHGIGLKQSYYSDLTHEMDLICVESRDRVDQLKSDGFNGVETGFVKLDLLKSQKELSTEPEVLYAPTYFPSSLKKTIPILTKLKDFKLKIKLHHFYWTNPTYIKIRKELESAIQTNSEIEIASFNQYNILPFYETADLLISDFSSTLFEFLALNRPIIQTTYSTLRLKYKLIPNLLNKRLDQHRISQVDFTVVCDSSEKLGEIIQKSLRSYTDLEEKRKKAKTLFLGQCDGKATERLITAINISGIPIGVSE